jgi:dienelactone hydrolase
MKRVLFWGGGVIAALVIAVAAYTVWAIRSVDPDVLPEHHGKVDARLFVGETTAGVKKPLVVAFGGAEGRNQWASKRWQAERERYLADGYAFLAIGYFGMPNTPAALDRISLDGVLAAIRREADHPAVDARCIAAVGVSKGGELALLLASHTPDVKAVAAIVPGNAVFVALTQAMTTSSFSLQGQALPFVPLPWRATWPLITGDKRRVFDIMMEDRDAVAKAAIAVERINGPVMFLSATQDEYWDSKGMSDAMMQRLRANAFKHASDHIAIAGDHAAPLKHLAEVRTFLNREFKPQQGTGCAR